MALELKRKTTLISPAFEDRENGLLKIQILSHLTGDIANLCFLAILRWYFSHILLVGLNDDRLEKEKQFLKS